MLPLDERKGPTSGDLALAGEVTIGDVAEKGWKDGWASAASAVFAGKGNGESSGPSGPSGASVGLSVFTPTPGHGAATWPPPGDGEIQWRGLALGF